MIISIFFCNSLKNPKSLLRAKKGFIEGSLIFIGQKIIF